MVCSICNDLRGHGDIWDKAMKGNRIHKVSGLLWDKFQSSAASCRSCKVLLIGCQGCFAQHNVHESNIIHCEIEFFYMLPADFEDEEPTDVNKHIRFNMKDGSRFEVEIFSLEGGKYITTELPCLDFLR